ncbi:unnamed protein product [Dovyalis caffra]|uniref:Uncharacterized protein n=1 Tax=Dovyalis caffra TaxID=77055 RepID=A0AAV1R8I4_9ROSI|nr:unnamed protein product [Dovyalis caffra]
MIRSVEGHPIYGLSDKARPLESKRSRGSERNKSIMTRSHNREAVRNAAGVERDKMRLGKGAVRPLDERKNSSCQSKAKGQALD